jgi:hypothetical protein
MVKVTRRTTVEPISKEEAFQLFSPTYLHCRTWGHLWDGEVEEGVTTLDALQNEVYNEYWRSKERKCTSCGYVVKTVYNHVWDVVYELQRYPKGYLMKHTGERATRLDGVRETLRRTKDAGT